MLTQYTQLCSFILSIAIIQIRLLSAQNLFCNTAYQCVGSAWDLSSNQEIYGFGYKSVSGSSTSITNNNANNHIYCYGTYSCTEISFILSESRLLCYGSHSCANIAGLSHIDVSNWVRCRGLNSCENTNLRSNNSVECGGDKSCRYANISAPTVYADGLHSLYGSTIDSALSAGGILKVYLRGYQSGFGGNIICRTGDTCTIYCYFNGCEMLHVLCEDNINCNIVLNSNDETVTIPPIQNHSNYNENTYASVYDPSYQTETLCNNNSSNNFVYENYEQQQTSINMNIHNGGPICCRGADSCRLTGTIQFTETPDIMVCSGESSCYSTNIITTGPTFCEGEYSCYSSNINGSQSVYCLGYNACRLSVITKSENIYCFGGYSCSASQIKSNGNHLNIHLLSYKSGYDLNFYCELDDECVITCGAKQSCSPQNTMLFCNNNCFVYCNDDTGCPNGNYTSSTVYTAFPTKSPTKSPTQLPTEATNMPTTVSPTTHNPTTSVPTTNQPTTNMPTTNMPTTNAPTTNAPTTAIPTTNAPTTNSPTTNAPTTSMPTTFNPTTNSPTTNAPSTSIPTTFNPTTNAPTTFNPTTNAPTTNIPTTIAPTSIPTTIAPTTATPTTNDPTYDLTKSPTTSEPTTVKPTKTPTQEKEVDITATLIFEKKGDESNITGTKTGSITVIAIIVIVMITVLLIGIIFFYFKRRKNRINKDKLETNIKNVEMNHSKTAVDDDDVVTAINETNMSSMQICDDDIVVQVNQTDIGDNERSDKDLIATVNATDIGGGDSDIITSVNNTYGGIPPKINKINSISNDDLDDVKNNNEGDDLINAVNHTAGAIKNDDFVVDGDSENEEMIGPGSHNNTMGMEVNATGESEGISYNMDEDGAKEVRVWLDSIGFNMYYDILLQNGFDSMESIQEISDKNVLQDIGVTLIGHQLKLLKYIKLSKTNQ